VLQIADVPLWWLENAGLDLEAEVEVQREQVRRQQRH
jgi:hypothetical protein